MTRLPVRFRPRARDTWLQYFIFLILGSFESSGDDADILVEVWCCQIIFDFRLAAVARQIFGPITSVAVGRHRPLSQPLITTTSTASKIKKPFSSIPQSNIYRFAPYLLGRDPILQLKPIQNVTRKRYYLCHRFNHTNDTTRHSTINEYVFAAYIYLCAPFKIASNSANILTFATTALDRSQLPTPAQAEEPQKQETHIRGGDRGGMCPGRFCFIIPCPLPCDFCII